MVVVSRSNIFIYKSSMTRFLSIWLLFAYSVALLRPYLPFLEYQINLEYYQEVLCENRDRPELNCDGKCYLAKQLQEAATSALPEAPQVPDSPTTEDFLWANLALAAQWLVAAAVVMYHFDSEVFTYVVHLLPPTPPPWA